MRIVIINTLTWDSSITKDIVYFADSLSKKDDVLIILRDEEGLKSFNFNDKIRSLFVKIPKIYHILLNMKMVMIIVKNIKSFKPDVIDIRCGYPWLCFGLLFLRKYPIVTAFNTAKPRKGEKEKIHYMIASYILAKYADQIITFGQTSKEIVAERFKIHLDDIQVVPFGNYAEAYTKPDIICNVEDINYILFFGRIVDYKGLEYLIRAEPYITEEIPNTKIIIAGHCDDFRYYEDLIKNRTSYYITHIRYIQSEMIPELFKKASVIVLPYTEYSESGNIQLAYAFKKPIVASNLGSISGYIINGETGYLVPPRDSKELAKAIIKILKNKELSKRMGEKGHELMKTVFSWDEIILKSKLVYERAVEIRK